MSSKPLSNKEIEEFIHNIAASDSCMYGEEGNLIINSDELGIKLNMEYDPKYVPAFIRTFNTHCKECNF